MPVVATIKVYRGEDIQLNMTMRPVRDITGWTISMTVAESYDSTAKTFQVTASLTNAPNGQYSILIPKATLNISPKTYVYDIFRVNPGNNRILNVGSFIVGADARNP